MKKLLPLTMLVSSVACGDTNNYNATAAQGNGENNYTIDSCQSAVQYQYQCGALKPEHENDPIEHVMENAMEGCFGMDQNVKPLYFNCLKLAACDVGKINDCNADFEY